MLVQVAAAEESVSLHLTCHTDNAHKGVPKRLPPLPGRLACCAGPRERGIQMEIREVDNSHEQLPILLYRFSDCRGSLLDMLQRSPRSQPDLAPFRGGVHLGDIPPQQRERDSTPALLPGDILLSVPPTLSQAPRQPSFLHNSVNSADYYISTPVVYTASLNLNARVRDFVKSGGPGEAGFWRDWLGLRPKRPTPAEAATFHEAERWSPLTMRKGPSPR